VEPGESADPVEIERSRTRVQGTGFFSDQRDIRHREPSYRFLETGDSSWKDLEFLVEEGQDLNFAISGGISSNLGAFGIVSLTKQNFDASALPRSPFSFVGEVANREAFHGAGQTLRIRASPGTQVSFFDVYFSEPDVFRRHKDRISLGLSASRQLRIYRSHDERRERYGFELGRQVTDDASVFAGFTLGTIDVDDISGGSEPSLGDPRTVPGSLRRQEGENDLSYFDFGYRMRTIDNPINPRNGVWLRFPNQVSVSGVSSDFDYVKSRVLFDFYDEFDEESNVASSRYHLDLQAGIAAPFGDSDEVPYSERFFLGGQTNMRGFEFRGVGPNEYDFPLGGETYVYGSLEYLIPIVKTTQPGTYREVETVYGGLFVDAGMLNPDAFTYDFEETRISAGFLFGIAVPLPVIFSFGFPLREDDGDRKQVLGFSIGF